MTVPSNAPVGRDPWLDNARFLLIALVVFGHLLEPLRESHRWLDAGYHFIYTFHMPAFAFLSGAVAHATPDSRLFRSVGFRLLWPYLIFQGLYALVALSPTWPDTGATSVVTPYWLLWYLLSLACWRVMLPFFARLRHRLLIATAVAVVAGCFSDIGYSLSLSRTLVFFPLFLLGWMAAHGLRATQPSWRARVAAVGLLVAVFAVVAWLRPDARWLYGSYGYSDLGSAMLPGMAIRLLLLATAAACTWACLTLVPRGPTWFSGFGARSLGAYVLQGFVIKFALGAGVFTLLSAWSGLALLPVLLLAATVTTLVLASPQIARVLQPMTSPRWLESWLWKPPATQNASGGPGRST